MINHQIIERFPYHHNSNIPSYFPYPYHQHMISRFFHRIPIFMVNLSCQTISLAGECISFPIAQSRFLSTTLPICSMYGIFTYIWVIYGANVGKYSIHGAYGICSDTLSLYVLICLNMIRIYHVHPPARVFYPGCWQ